jgi:hypothetical protein
MRVVIDSYAEVSFPKLSSLVTGVQCPFISHLVAVADALLGMINLDWLDCFFSSSSPWSPQPTLRISSRCISHHF